MTTVNTLVQDAMYQAGVLGQDQTPSSGDVQLVLRRLNRMLDSWANEKLMIFRNDEESFLMTAGQASYQTSVFADGRPIAFNSMRVRLNNIDYPVDFIDQQKWNGISYKSTTAIPRYMYYDSNYPTATMFFYPIPYAAFTCYAYCQRQLQGSVDLATTLSMSLGYEAAIVAALAVDIMPSFGKQATAQQIADMRSTKANLKRTNYSPLEMVTPFDEVLDLSNSFPYRGF